MRWFNQHENLTLNLEHSATSQGQVQKTDCFLCSCKAKSRNIFRKEVNENQKELFASQLIVVLKALHIKIKLWPQMHLKGSFDRIPCPFSRRHRQQSFIPVHPSWHQHTKKGKISSLRSKEMIHSMACGQQILTGVSQHQQIKPQESFSNVMQLNKFARFTHDLWKIIRLSKFWSSSCYSWPAKQFRATPTKYWLSNLSKWELSDW